ncbi:MAG: hypothetical protein AAFN93_03650 [Bacteroidota bacterium]
MLKLNRSTLKNYFKNGKNPSEEHFGALIDSTINQIDDGFGKNSKDGIQLFPLGNSKNLISFYENVSDSEADWRISINPDERTQGLAFSDKSGKSRLFLGEGKVGIGTTHPSTSFDVKGTTKLATRIGGYLVGKVKADGAWHPIIEKLSDCHAFEVVAKAIGARERGRYAMAHAIAVNVFGSRKSKINVTQSYYGGFWNKIKFRWRGEPSNYQLEIKTGTDYSLGGEETIYIHYHIAKLWDDSLFFKSTVPKTKAVDSKQ